MMFSMKPANTSLRLILPLILILAYACGNSHPPKPRGYFRISLPEKEYTVIDTTLPYTFEQPGYAKIKPDEEAADNEPYWANLAFPRFEAKVHLSYKKIEDNLYQLFEDNRELAFKHSVKADAIKERLFESPENDVYGILYEIKGNTASPVQFYVTDSTDHFLRGSLYFNTVPNKDSIAPVLDFIREDIVHLMETLKWKELQNASDF
ncbi:MAG: gliding motility lipoprotein GldD [Marinilabilia sp.]